MTDLMMAKEYPDDGEIVAVYFWRTDVERWANRGEPSYLMTYSETIKIATACKAALHQEDVFDAETTIWAPQAD